eukprot:TRINITY_DN25918_c0_g1_i1.p1 TRINITY_DN25918_c0_g1~~TRINITY_DN25918_c0_g1_i1.p1  ORF type:complete len:343 (-),score=80.64 TRINITY_DN25918_c0_g1_i1:111-1112(-)
MAAQAHAQAHAQAQGAGVKLAESLLNGLPNIPRHIQNLVLEISNSKGKEIDFEKYIRSLEEHTEIQIAEETKLFLNGLNGQLEEHIGIYNGIIKELLNVIHKKEEKCRSLVMYEQLSKRNTELKINLKKEEDALQQQFNDKENLRAYVDKLQTFAVKNADISNNFQDLKLPATGLPTPNLEKHARLEAIKRKLYEERREYDRLQQEILEVSEQNEYLARVVACKQRYINLDENITSNFNANSRVIEEHNLAVESNQMESKVRESSNLKNFCDEETSKLSASIASWDNLANGNFSFLPMHFNNLVAMEAEKFNRILNPKEVLVTGKGKKRKLSH